MSEAIHVEDVDPLLIEIAAFLRTVSTKNLMLRDLMRIRKEADDLEVKLGEYIAAKAGGGEGGGLGPSESPAMRGGTARNGPSQ
jgi:hypothetical protein